MTTTDDVRREAITQLEQLAGSGGWESALAALIKIEQLAAACGWPTTLGALEDTAGIYAWMAGTETRH